MQTSRYTNKLFAIALFGFAISSPAHAEQLAIVGATIYDGTRSESRLDDGIIVVDSGRIQCVGSPNDCPVPEHASRKDFSGHFITPGLVDAHVHFMLGGWYDTRQDAGINPDRYDYEAAVKDLRDHPDRAHRSYLCSGVTGVFDAGGFPWSTKLGHAAEHHPEHAHVAAAGPLITHFEQAFPLFTALGESAFLPMESDAEAIASVQQLAEMGADAVKVWYVPPKAEERDELDARLRLIGREANRAGLPLVLHATDLRGAKVGVSAGAHALLHSIDDQLVDEELLTLAKEQGTYYAPTLTIARNWAHGFAAIAAKQAYPIDDPNNCIDAVTRAKVEHAESLHQHLPESALSPIRLFRWFKHIGFQQAMMVENLRRVHAAGIPVATATDAGHPLTFHGPSIYAEMEAMEKAGIAAREIIVMSTRNGASVMNRLDDLGTLEAGKIADLAIYSEDPGQTTKAFRSVTHVMRNGEMRPISYFARPDP